MKPKVLGWVTLVLLFEAGDQIMSAATVVSDTGRDAYGWAARSDEFSFISWTQTQPYTDVTITARLFSPDLSDVGTTYLTTRFGPGTTPGDQVRTASFTFPSGVSASDVVLFSGISLSPGTYYLSIGGGANYNAAWYGTDQATLLVDGSVTYNGSFYVQDPAAYPPASSYAPSPWMSHIFSVTGTPVPEPTTLAIGTLGLGAFLFLRRLRYERDG